MGVVSLMENLTGFGTDRRQATVKSQTGATLKEPGKLSKTIYC